jgi:hypothetical protein
MMQRGIVIFAAAAALLMPLPSWAHHGSAAFDSGKEVTLKGRVLEWIFANPHCLLRLQVTAEDGTESIWIAEGQAPNTIFPNGYRKDSFKGGDQVSIKVEPAKNGRPMGRILGATLADGKVLGRASSLPPIVTAEPQP